MKQIICTMLIALFCFQYSYAQDTEEEITIDDSTIIRDDKGKTVDIDKFMSLLDTGNWTFDSKKDKNGNPFIKLRKTSQQEKKEIAQMILEEEELRILNDNKSSDFKLKGIDGNYIISENSEGKLIVFNFWFTACKPYLSELPKLKAVYKKDKLEAFLKDNPIVADSKSAINNFSINSYPTNIVIDKNGNYLEVMLLVVVFRK